jgi:hypothetical protein
MYIPQDATFAGAKELFTKESIINSTLAHVALKKVRCISLNTLMYLQYKYL